MSHIVNSCALTKFGQLLSIDQVWRWSTALTWSRWGCRRLADNMWLLAHDNNNSTDLLGTVW